ncbi:unnamed protein product [Rotaria sp. Silwood1]|nr:unnamed protein product [Rotaria sp. Silwood1]
MDSMFNNGHNTNFDLVNNGGLSSTDNLKLMMNQKRKLESTVIINGIEKHQENGNDHVKRLCTTNDHEQKK